MMLKSKMLTKRGSAKSEAFSWFADASSAKAKLSWSLFQRKRGDVGYSYIIMIVLGIIGIIFILYIFRGSFGSLGTKIMGLLNQTQP